MFDIYIYIYECVVFSCFILFLCVAMPFVCVDFIVLFMFIVIVSFVIWFLCCVRFLHFAVIASGVDALAQACVWFSIRMQGNFAVLVGVFFHGRCLACEIEGFL